MSDNPFQSPAPIDEPEIALAVDGELPPITTQLVKATILRWIVICAVSAIPSFMLGMIVTNASLLGNCAMGLGILLFAIGYTAFDLYLLRRWCHNSPSFHRALRIGLGFRMTASVIFPIGWFIDMYPGIAAIAIFNMFESLGGPANAPGPPLIIAITLVQGLFMNILLYGFVLFVFGVIRISRGELFRTRSEQKTVVPPA